jgi:hypothetical protein
MKKTNKWIAYLGGIVGVYLLYMTIKKQTNSEVINFTKEPRVKLLNFNDFIAQDYPLLQIRMMEAIIDDLNSAIKTNGVDWAISKTNNIINILRQSEPTITQNEMIYFYTDILTRLNRLK